MRRTPLLRCQKGWATLSFLFTLFWTFIILFVFIQMALIGFTWQVTGYAAYASARSRIVGQLFNADYKDTARNVMSNSLPPGWGKTWIVQELPIAGVLILYGQKVLGIPVPVFGRAEVPYSQLNPFNPTFLDKNWSVGDNNG
jgi:hypothetical protein